jgi:hypothetical protein
VVNAVTLCHTILSKPRTATPDHAAVSALADTVCRMRVRWVGLVLALALVAGAVGYRLGTDHVAAPASFAADPIVAASPSYPVIPAVVVPDNPAPALHPGVRVRRQTVGSPPFQVELPVPREWVRSDPNAGESRWYPSWQLAKNVYFIKVLQIGNGYRTIDSAVRNRIADLDSAGDVTDLEVERGPDRLAASYVADEHRRFSYEGYLSRPGSGFADVYVAVVGRRVDRAGLKDLFDKLMSEAEIS